MKRTTPWRADLIIGWVLSVWIFRERRKTYAHSSFLGLRRCGWGSCWRRHFEDNCLSGVDGEDDEGDIVVVLGGRLKTKAIVSQS
jgi:hypothetical protein